MKRHLSLPTLAILALGVALGAVVASPFGLSTPGAAAQSPGPKPAPTVISLQADVELMKGKLPGQAHAMIDVSYHFTNLWFAGQRGNWPLAQFYLNESRSHLRWAVRIIPVRKDAAGREIKLEEILQAVENTPLKQLEAAIKTQNREQFTSAYELTITGCYACHKAADKPYLTLKVPDHPAEALIDFTPPVKSDDADAK